jgi:hypothetical protein
MPADVPADPAPKRGPGRPRKETATTQGNRSRVPARTASGKIMSKSAMQAKVAAELYTYLSLFAAGWEMRDPECAAVVYDQVTIPTERGPVQVERLQGVVDRMVAIISRNQAVLETMANSGIIGEIAMIGHLLWPIGRQLWSAHGPAGRGHTNEQEQGDDYASRYPAYTPAFS